MRRVLIVIHADPEESGRALEGLRMSVGLALAGNGVEVVLQGAASGLLDDAGVGAPAHRRAGEFLSALRDLGGAARCGEFSLGDARRAEVVIRWGE